MEASMPKGPKLTRDELDRALGAYFSTGTYEAAARAIGRDASVVRRALLRRGVDASVDSFALQVERAEWDVLQAAQSLAKNAANLARWSARPAAEPGTVTINTETLQSALDATNKAAALVSKLSLACERRKLLRARRKLAEEERRTLRAAREQAQPPERVRVVVDESEGIEERGRESSRAKLDGAE